MLTIKEDLVKFLHNLGILPDSCTCKIEHRMELYPINGFAH